MATAKKTTARKSSSSSESGSEDAIKLLTQDHKEVEALFKQYEKLVDEEAEDEEKQEIAQQICMLLSAHATVEEEIFYPAAREVLGEDEDLVDEAEVEHSTAKDLIAQLESASPADELYDAKVKVLGEYIRHHVKEEEGEMFPKLKKLKDEDFDLAALGDEIAARKEELLGEQSDEEAEEA
ncbi:hemerythrin domain-containing protein [Roseateles violae]|uniref:Hemerythrin domain-containing protein n=1 Tax=Roseateles violae TaxID=3058042 RepID=A0ABT8DQX5_9BURK|nr:hemerythrin domain-containing protein [Pelomonas sp. PFR6]MDN3919483.1 hemerythrin domain-containing protein [Pelomonas sp. PFR6]